MLTRANRIHGFIVVSAVCIVSAPVPVPVPAPAPAPAPAAARLMHTSFFWLVKFLQKVSTNLSCEDSEVDHLEYASRSRHKKNNIVACDYSCYQKLHKIS